MVTTHCHLPAIHSCTEAELVAVVDADSSWAESIARQCGVRTWSTDYRDLASIADAVLVATPNATHAEIACFLLERGVHVLCEKPMATTVADARRMLSAAERGGARLMAGLSRRFGEAYETVKALVSSRRLGRLSRVSVGLGHPYSKSQSRTHFRKDPRLAGGGVLMEVGIHLVDIAVWLSEEAVVEIAHSFDRSPGWSVETDAEVSLRFANGCEAALWCSYTRHVDSTLRVEGSEGWAELSGQELTVSIARAMICRHDGAQRLLFPPPSFHSRQLEHFCRSLLTSMPFCITPDQVLEGIGVVERCYQRDGAQRG